MLNPHEKLFYCKLKVNKRKHKVTTTQKLLQPHELLTLDIFVNRFFHTFQYLFCALKVKFVVVIRKT